MPGRIGQHLVALAPAAVPIAADAALTDVTPGTMTASNRCGQPGVHVHVGAVEQRIALGQQRHVAARVQVRGDPVGRLGVEILHRARIAAGMVGGLGGDRVDQVLLDLPRPQVGLGDATGDAAAVPGAVVGDDVGLADHPGRLDRDQFGVAGPKPDAPERASARVIRCRSRSR